MLNMREMTRGELRRWYDEGQWPCGHGTTYVPGPRGGIMRNIACPVCTMRMNVVDPEYGRRIPVGQVLFEPEGYVPPPDEPDAPPTMWQNIVSWWRSR